MLDEPAFTTRMVSVFAIGSFRLLVALAFKEGVPGGHTIFPGWCADQTMGPGCGARAGPWAVETLGCAHEDRRQALQDDLLNDDGWSVEIIDQTKLPHAFETVTLRSLQDAAQAIKAMLVRGAPLIGATAAYGVCLAMRDDDSDEALDCAYPVPYATRPTAEPGSAAGGARGGQYG